MIFNSEKIPRVIFPPTTALWQEETHNSEAGNVFYGYSHTFREHSYREKDYETGLKFILYKSTSNGSMLGARCAIEKLFLWSWLILGRSALALDEEDINNFIDFSRDPPESWVSEYNCPRSVKRKGARLPNDKWRPFVRRRDNVAKEAIGATTGTTRITFRFCAVFFDFAMSLKCSSRNPARQTLDARIWGRQPPCLPVENILTQLESQYLMKTAHQMAADNPQTHERSLFIISAIVYGCFKSTDFSGNESPPTMGCFRKQNNGWLFACERYNHDHTEIHLGSLFMDYLQRYRRSRGLAPFPQPGETELLVETVHGRAGLTARQVRNIVGNILKVTIENMRQDGCSKSNYSNLRTASASTLRNSAAHCQATFKSMPELMLQLGLRTISPGLQSYYLPIVIGQNK